MKNSWNWVVLIGLGILFAIIIECAGDSFLASSWGSVALNLISDYLFVLLVATIVGALYWIRSSKARSFFGIKKNIPLQIVISAHVDNETTTGRVFTAEEYDAAEELRIALQRQFPGVVAFLAGLFGIDLGPLDVVVKGSPVDKLDNYPFQGGLIVIGGPTRNKVAEFIVDSEKPNVIFDDDKKSFLIRKDGEEQYQKLNSSDEFALIQKLVVDGNVVIIAFGFGEIGTSIAVRELSHNWRNLWSSHKALSFSLLLQIERGEIIQRTDY
jgi:hypothetical protein